MRFSEKKQKRCDMPLCIICNLCEFIPLCLLLSVWGNRFIVVNDLREGEVYDSVEYSRAFFTLFEGAIYLHQVGRSVGRSVEKRLQPHLAM